MNPTARGSPLAIPERGEPYPVIRNRPASSGQTRT